MPHASANDKNLTTSGFIKQEVYMDLVKAFRDKNIEKVCWDMVELASIRNESPTLLIFLVEHISNFILCKNVWPLEQIASKFRSLMCLPKRNLVQNPVFQSLMTECFMIVALMKQHAHGASFLLTEHSCVVEIIEPLIYNYGDHFHANVTKFCSLHGISLDIGKYFNLLYNRLRHGDKKGVIAILSWLITWKDDCGLLDVIKFDEMSALGNEVHTMKHALKQDLIWVVWSFLIMYTEEVVRKSTSIKSYTRFHSMIKSCLYLYSFMFQKKHRLPRINLLFHPFVLLCTDIKHDMKWICRKDVDLQEMEAHCKKALALFKQLCPSTLSHTHKNVAAAPHTKSTHRHHHEQHTQASVAYCYDGDEDEPVLIEHKPIPESIVIPNVEKKQQSTMDYLKLYTYME